MKFNQFLFPVLSLLAAAEAAKLTIIAYTDSIATIYVDGYDLGTVSASEFTGQALTDYNANGKRFDVEVGGGDHQVAVLARNANGDSASFLAAVLVDGVSRGATGGAGWKAKSESLTFVPPNRAWARLGFDDSAWGSLPTNSFCDSRTFNTAGRTVWFDGKCSAASGAADAMLVRYKVSMPVFNVPNPILTNGASSADTPFVTSISLAQRPSCDVVVQVESDPTRTNTDRCRLTFTRDNWNISQTVTSQLVHHNVSFAAQVQIPLRFVSYSTCYDDVGLHGASTSVTLIKSYDTTSAPSICKSWGDPAFQAFDGYVDLFHGAGGESYYYMNSTELTVQGRHRQCVSNGITCGDGYSIRFRDTVATIINGVVEIYSPRIAGDGRLPAGQNTDPANYMTRSGSTLIVDGGPSAGGASFSGSHYMLQFSLSRKYFGRTRGLCGNYNGANEQANAANGYNGEIFAEWSHMRSVGMRADPIWVRPGNRYITDQLNSADIQTFRNLVNSARFCTLSPLTRPADPVDPVNLPEGGNTSDTEPSDDAEIVIETGMVEVLTTINGQATRIQVITSSTVVRPRSTVTTADSLAPAGDLESLAIGASVAGGVLVIGMGAFLIRRRRQMVEEATTTVYAIESVMSAQSGGVTGESFVENPLYDENTSVSVSSNTDGGESAVSDFDYSTISSIHSLHSINQSAIVGMNTVGSDRRSVRSSRGSPLKNDQTMEYSTSFSVNGDETNLDNVV